jgi:hypothetical protein
LLRNLNEWEITRRIGFRCKNISDQTGDIGYEDVEVTELALGEIR